VALNERTTMTDRAVIVDIDGTLAVRTGDRSPIDWHRVGEDEPNPPVVELVQILAASRRHRLILMSGRDESCRWQTEMWLNAQGVPFNELYMRPEKDNRNDSIVKEELYRKRKRGAVPQARRRPLRGRVRRRRPKSGRPHVAFAGTLMLPSRRGRLLMDIPNVLLSGVVGSTAYGLAGPDSDIDRLGVFAAPTAAFHGLTFPDESIVSSKPDATFHEARKYCTLALGGNPTVSELMWLDTHETITPLGEELIGIRTAFLSAKRTRDAYLGYSTQQFRKLEARGDGSFSADTRKRTAKHARHLMRLCAQGLELYTTGTLRIRLANPQRYLDFGERVAGGDIEHARSVMAGYEAAFDDKSSVLPDEPNRAAVEDWLLRVRANFYKTP
jgi:hypothetical protein